MRIGDQEWRDKAAKILRGIRRDVDRDFAKDIAKNFRRMQESRFGEVLKSAKPVTN